MNEPDNGNVTPLKLMDQMASNKKYQKMKSLNKALEEKKELSEIKQFEIQRAMFERMRQVAMDQQAASSEGMDGPFNVKINSHGKLEDQSNEQ